MKRTIWTLAAAGLVAVTVAPAEASAQQGEGWWDWALPALMGGEPVRTPQGTVIRVPDTRAPSPTDRRGDARSPVPPRDRDIYRDRDVRRDRGGQARGRGQARGQGGGPPFCQPGASGHPVFGRDWCRQRGFGHGGGTWQRGGWEDVIFRAPRDRRHGATDQRGVIDVLGDVVFGRLDNHRRQLGARGALEGRWQNQRGIDVFQVRAGGVPIAELTDLDGDGRVDVVLLSRGN